MIQETDFLFFSTRIQLLGGSSIFLQSNEFKDPQRISTKRLKNPHLKYLSHFYTISPTLKEKNVQTDMQ